MCVAFCCSSPCCCWRPCLCCHMCCFWHHNFCWHPKPFSFWRLFFSTVSAVAMAPCCCWHCCADYRTIGPQLSDWSFLFFRSEHVQCAFTYCALTSTIVYFVHTNDTASARLCAASFVCWNVPREELYRGSRFSVPVYTLYSISMD